MERADGEAPGGGAAFRPLTKLDGGAIGAVGEDQRAAAFRHENLPHLADEDMVRADAVGRDDPAVEGGQRVHYAGRAGLHRRPVGAVELAFSGDAAGEAVGDIGLVVGEDVRAETAVLDDLSGGGGHVVDADQHGRPPAFAIPVGGDGGHGGNSDARPPRRAVRGHDVHRGGGAGHALKELGAEVGGGHFDYAAVPALSRDPDGLCAEL